MSLSDDALSDLVASFAELAESARREGGTLRVKASELRVVAGRVADLAGDCINYRAALTEIAKGEGSFSRDQLEHAGNAIESMKALARAALEGPCRS